MLDLELKSPVKAVDSTEPAPPPDGTADGVRDTLRQILWRKAESLKETGKKQQTTLNKLRTNQEKAFKTAQDAVPREATNAAARVCSIISQRKKRS